MRDPKLAHILVNVIDVLIMQIVTYHIAYLTKHA